MNRAATFWLRGVAPSEKACQTEDAAGDHEDEVCNTRPVVLAPTTNTSGNDQKLCTHLWLEEAVIAARKVSGGVVGHWTSEKTSYKRTNERRHAADIAL